MGLLQSDPESWFAGHVEGELSAGAIESIIDHRNAARAAKDFEAADAYRDQLSNAGIKIEDGQARENCWWVVANRANKN